MMTNEQKHKTAEERVAEFGKFCNGKGCTNCIIKDKPAGSASCAFYWLSLEAEEEKPEPCPFCGSECKVIGNVNHRVRCSKCNYESIMDSDKEKTIAAHNRIAKAVRAAEKGEVTK